MGLPEEKHAEAPDAQRLDRWLWFSRLVKSRTQAGELLVQGKIRINRVRASKASQTVKAGDVLTIASRGKVRIVKILALGDRRGPPQEAQGLYEALGPRRTASSGHAT
jgi:ribosome-associated heat shock protein Hsp15